MSSGAMPRAGQEARSAFLELLPDDPAVATRPMFGNLAGFVNGNMFAGVFGEDLFVRLPDPEMEELLNQGGASFEPMPGRAMKGYVTLPGGWRQEPVSTRDWIDRSLRWSRQLPAKESKRR